jgi:hypothetical protein
LQNAANQPAVHPDQGSGGVCPVLEDKPFIDFPLAVRQIILACKIFFDIIIGNYNLDHRNPFRGKGIIPDKQRLKPLEVPGETEAGKVLEAAEKLKDKTIFVALSFVRKYGLRIGAFEKAVIRGSKLTTVTKGKTFDLDLDAEDLKLWKLPAIGLNGHSAKNLESRVDRFFTRTWQRGIVNHKYSVHKIRHFFACDLYRKTRDMVKVSVALNHSNAAVTGTCFTSLKKESNVKI